jgi:hypothetical protein
MEPSALYDRIARLRVDAHYTIYVHSMLLRVYFERVFPVVCMRTLERDWAIDIPFKGQATLYPTQAFGNQMTNALGQVYTIEDLTVLNCMLPWQPPPTTTSNEEDGGEDEDEIVDERSCPVCGRTVHRGEQVQRCGFYRFYRQGVERGVFRSKDPTRAKAQWLLLTPLEKAGFKNDKDK